MSKTTNYALNKPSRGTRDWDSLMNTNMDTVDAEMKRLTDKDADQDVQISNIVSQSGTDNTEIVDARLGADNVSRDTLGTLTREIHKQLIEQNDVEKVLVHGISVLNSDIASTLKVEFYGNTLVNRSPNFNSGLWNLGYVGGVVSVDSDRKITHTDTTTQTYSRIKLNVKPNEYYLISSDHTGEIRVDDFDGTNTTEKVAYTTNNTVKFVGSANINEIFLILKGYNGQYFSNVRLYKITQEQYDKIGVSLTDSDVERLFPYVDSIKGVKNPSVKVSGSNLLPPFTEWNLHANAKVVSPYELELNATAGYQANTVTVNTVKGQKYTIAKLESDGSRIYILDNKNNVNLVSTTANMATFTAGSEETLVRFDSTISGIFTFSQPMLNLGSTALPFVDKNDSYMYFSDVTLYGNSVEKDILYRNESLDVPRWEVKREFQPKVISGVASENWRFVSDHVGYKLLRMAISGHNTSVSPIVEKFDGSILTHTTDYNELTSKPNMTYQNSSDLFITVSDTDTGWAEDYTPLTTDMNTFFANENYFLLYQLANPVVEPVTVEGDVSISGIAQVEVNTGIQWKVPITPQLYGTQYRINDTQVPNSLFEYEALKIIDIFKNDEIDTSNWLIDESGSNAYGQARAFTESGYPSYDNTAQYYATFELLNKHDFTTNLNNVKATYQTSLKSSFQSQVSKTSDLATEVSVLDRQMLDVLIRLDAGGL